jgi:hypothetical protein
MKRNLEGDKPMRILTITIALFIALAAIGAASAQAPKDRGPDDPPPPAGDRPQGEAPRPRREPRAGDDQPQPQPPPGKGPKGKTDGPRYTPPAPTPYPMPPGGPFPNVPGTPSPPVLQPGLPDGVYNFPDGRAVQRSRGVDRMMPPGMVQRVPGGPGPFGEPPPDDPEMRELMKQDAELEHQSHQMAQKFREARGEEREEARKALANAVAKHFEVRQERRELQIKRMEEELKRLRDEIAKRNDAQKTIIDNRFRELTGESRDLDF